MIYQGRDRIGGVERRLGRIVARHGLDKVALAYPGWERRDLLTLLEESERSAASEYEPYAEFRPVARRGRFVNVSENGYRLVRRQGPWPPRASAFNVFVFGGSTTFGLGVPDGESIPSLLADRLAQAACGRPANVYNFGRPGYLSRQEAVLFEQLLIAGAVPDLAIFVDGLNEFFIWPRPLAADKFRAALVGWSGATRTRLLDWLGGLPMGRLAWGIRARAWPERPEPHALAREELPVEQALAQWKAGARLVEGVARAYGVRVLFVWQPIPAYKYDTSRHLFFDASSVAHWTAPRLRRGYELLDAERQQHEPVEHLLWLADIQQDRRENLYVSEFHYRPPLAEEIATRIAGTLREKALLACEPAAP